MNNTSMKKSRPPGPYSLVWNLMTLWLCGVLAGCYTTREMSVEYPLSQEIQAAINESMGGATLILSDSQTVSAQTLTVDSLSATWSWLEEQTTAPLEGIRSITIIDPDEYWTQTWKGALWGGVGFAVLGVVLPPLSGAPVVIGEVAGGAFAGALGAILTRNIWGYIADPRVTYVLMPRGE